MAETTLMVIAHTPGATAMVAGVHHVLGERPERLLALDVPADTTPECVAEQALSELRARGAGPVLLLSDLRGATPCNAAEQVAAHWHLPTRLVVGVNLPMLLVLLEQPKTAPVVELAWRARSAGRRWVRAPRVEQSLLGVCDGCR